jgi:FtsP/CotA-like multicopper oxidase with cupredoxin domain
VLPGETVRIKIPFTHHPGLYLYHCHILEHEDMGMMRNFRVVGAISATQ